LLFPAPRIGTTPFKPVLLAIAGSLKVTNVDGADRRRSVRSRAGFNVTGLDTHNSVTLLLTIINGATALNYGAGNDMVKFDNAQLAALAIHTGSGNDPVEIDASLNDDVGTTIIGVESIKPGSGNDAVLFGLEVQTR